MPVATTRASSFLNTLGVNTHIRYTDGGYANIGNVSADLAYLGINQIRDQISDGDAGSAPLESYITLAKTGVQFTININGSDLSDLQSDLALADQLNKAVPGSVIAIEGPNEVNNGPFDFNGVSGLTGAVNLQKALYGLVHADTSLKGVAVDYFTGYAAGSIGVGPNPATTSGLADYDTQHPYPNDGEAPADWVSRAQALGNETPATGPAVYTETGYTTNGGTDGAVNQDVQAKYTLDLLMDTAKNGIAHTYLYQLEDAYQPGSPQGDDGFGLFDPNNAPKEAAKAIHNLTAILADTGASAKTFTTTPLDYTIAGLASTGNSLEIQKSNGATEIVVWNEPQIWNESTGTEISAATKNATVSLGQTYQTVEIYDPLKGSAPIKTLSNVSSVTIGLTDHPIIIQVEPKTAPSTGSGSTSGSTTPGTIALNISEDAYKGDAKFTVSVDGKQVGGDLTASTLHSSGDAGVFLLTGNYGTGSHTVDIKFLNDAYDGTPATDRNLYVKSIAFNGTTESGTSASLYSTGDAKFVIGGSTVAGTAPADKLTLNLSEDAYTGNATFVLYIDGKAVTTPQVVSALHEAQATQGFTFSGDFGAGNHTIGVAFVNDAYAGTSSTDRNLYVGGVSLNGASVFSGEKELASNGVANFTVTTTH
jgi:hypothetical protein